MISLGRGNIEPDSVDPSQAVNLATKDLSSGADPTFWVRVALLQRDQNRHDVAEEILRRVISSHPTSEAAYYELAFIFRLQERPREAMQVMELYPGKNFGNRIQMFRGHMLHALGAHPEADEALGEVDTSSSSDRSSLRAMFAFGRYLKELPLGRALVMLDRVRVGFDWLDARALASRIGGAISQRAPFAMVRLGDGEGGMIKLSENDEANYYCLYERNRRELIQMWFGEGFDWMNGSFLKQAHDLPAAIAITDVVGIPYESWIRHEYGIASLRGVPSLVNIYRYLSQSSFGKGKVICSQHVHLDLFKEGHLVPLIQAAHKISVISCLSGLDVLLRDRFGIDEVITYSIPAEQGSRHLLGVDVGGGIHYPDAFNRLNAELQTPHNGRLFLVAAGLLGKFYCATIRAYGGIALDVGSLVDAWTGRKTRPGYDKSLEL